MKVRHMDYKYNIGIIGPRSFIAGGHDVYSEHRIKLREDFYRILSRIDQPYQSVGLTGLGLGPEQDFAISCRELNIPYSSYLAFPNQEERWINLPEANRKFQELLADATGILFVSNGFYSPKKIEKKNQKIVEDADLLIFVETPLSPFNYMIPASKEIIRIKYWELPV